MKKILIALTAVFALSGYTDVENANRILEANGYSDIHFTGYDFFACSDETFSTGFEAKGPTGKSVKGAVCSNMFHQE